MRKGTPWRPEEDDLLYKLLQRRRGYICMVREFAALGFNRTESMIRGRRKRLFEGTDFDDHPNDDVVICTRQRICREDDIKFQTAMIKAIRAGLEHAPIGIDTHPCTERPITIKPDLMYSSEGSPSQSLVELGTYEGRLSEKQAARLFAARMRAKLNDKIKLARPAVCQQSVSEYSAWPAAVEEIPGVDSASGSVVSGTEDASSEADSDYIGTM